MVVGFEEGVAMVARADNGGNGIVAGQQVLADCMAEGHTGRLVLAVRAAFDDVETAVGDYHGFRGLGVAGAERLELLDYTDVVVA